MRHHKSNTDACYGAVLLLMALLALAFCIFTIEWDLHAFAEIPRDLIYYPLGILFVFALIARWQLFHSQIRWWVYSMLILSSGYIICFDSGWFYNEMHDLALEYFGSHGRFGCHDTHYSSYIFKDSTAAWILFGPFILFTVLHWLWRSETSRKQVDLFWRWIMSYERRAA